MIAPPPRPPPRPAPYLEPDATALVEVPPVIASVPPPPGVPTMSVRVPSLTPGGAPGLLTGPPGTQLTIPGLPPSLARWGRAHAFPLLVLAVVAGLTWFDRLPAGVLTALFSLLVGVQIERPRVAGEGPIVLATVPPISSSSSSSSSSPPGAGPPAPGVLA